MLHLVNSCHMEFRQSFSPLLLLALLTQKEEACVYGSSHSQQNSCCLLSLRRERLTRARSSPFSSAPWTDRHHVLIQGCTRPLTGRISVLHPCHVTDWLFRFKIEKWKGWLFTSFLTSHCFSTATCRILFCSIHTDALYTQHTCCWLKNGLTWSRLLVLVPVPGKISRKYMQGTHVATIKNQESWGPASCRCFSYICTSPAVDHLDQVCFAKTKAPRAELVDFKIRSSTTYILHHYSSVITVSYIKVIAVSFVLNVHWQK